MHFNAHFLLIYTFLHPLAGWRTMLQNSEKWSFWRMAMLSFTCCLRKWELGRFTLKSSPNQISFQSLWLTKKYCMDVGQLLPQGNAQVWTEKGKSQMQKNLMSKRNTKKLPSKLIMKSNLQLRLYISNTYVGHFLKTLLHS